MERNPCKNPRRAAIISRGRRGRARMENGGPVIHPCHPRVVILKSSLFVLLLLLLLLSIPLGNRWDSFSPKSFPAKLRSHLTLQQCDRTMPIRLLDNRRVKG